MHSLNPGEWYALFVCRGCNAKQVLFRDLSNGASKIQATYDVTCSRCGCQGIYDIERLERYQHQMDGDGNGDGDGDGER